MPTAWDTMGVRLSEKAYNRITSVDAEKSLKIIKAGRATLLIRLVKKFGRREDVQWVNFWLESITCVSVLNKLQ